MKTWGCETPHRCGEPCTSPPSDLDADECKRPAECINFSTGQHLYRLITHTCRGRLLWYSVFAWGHHVARHCIRDQMLSFVVYEI